MEKVQLWFSPSGRRGWEGARWSATFNGKLVRLCNQSFCPVCNLTEREALKKFSGGKLEVELQAFQRPSFWEERVFYIGHVVAVPTQTEETKDEGIEFDVSRSNTLIYSARAGALVVDPGSMGFEGDEAAFGRLISGKKIMAGVVTHGHLDHWNNLGLLPASTYMNQRTFELASRHASASRDYRLVGSLRRAKMVVPGQPVLLEDDVPIRIDTFPFPHSIPETMGLVIRGERKRVVHLGDFKFNGMDAEQKAETISTLQEIGREKVDLLALNIINAHIEGFTPLESLVIESLTDIMVGTEGRVIISCFSTNLERIRRLIVVARLLSRPVQFLGTGMKAAKEFLGLGTEEEEGDFDRAIVFSTGCQAEPNSALLRIARRENSSFESRDTDTVVFCSRAIPGNGPAVKEEIESLLPQVKEVWVNTGESKQLGLDASSVKEKQVHVTGHGCKEDCRLVLRLEKPEKVVVWPQTSPQIEAFREIAEPLGVEILNEKERVIEV